MPGEYESMKVSLIADSTDLDSKIAKARADLDKFDQAKKERAKVRFTATIADLQVKLDKVRKDLRQFKKDGDEAGQVKARMEILGLQKNVTQARKFLRDLDKDTSKTSKGFFHLNGIVRDAVKAFGGLYILRSVKNLFTDVIGSAISFESAFAGVRKTVDATEEEFAFLAQEFRGLSKEIPISVEELLRIGELGGQLGVAKENLVEFTDVVAKLGVTTNLTTEAAATSFARISNILAAPIGDIERMGSSVVALGNNFAATESEIVNFGERISGVGNVVNLTAADIFGISTAFVSVGAEAESGGTAVQKALLAINSAVNSGGEELDKFARVSGRTSSQFKDDFQKTPAIVFRDFIKGLSQAGGQADVILSDLIGNNDRVKKSFLSLAGNADILTEALDISNTEFARNLALNEEAQKRFSTTESKIQLLKNTFNDLSVAIGSLITDFLSPGIDTLNKTDDTTNILAKSLSYLSAVILSIGQGIVSLFDIVATTVAQIGLVTQGIFKSFSGIVQRIFNTTVDAMQFLLDKFVDATNLALAATDGAVQFLSGGLADVAFRAKKIDLGNIKIADENLDSIDDFNQGMIAAIHAGRDLRDRLESAGNRINNAFSSASKSNVAGFSAQKEAADKLASSLDGIGDFGDDFGGGAGKATKAMKELSKEAEKQLKVFTDGLDDVADKSEKLADKVKDFYAGIADGIKEASQKQKELAQEFEDFRNEETEDFVKDLAQRNVEILQEEEELQKKIDDLKKDAAKEQLKLNSDIASQKDKAYQNEQARLEKIAALQDKIAVLELKRGEFSSTTKQSTILSNTQQLEKAREDLAELNQTSYNAELSALSDTIDQSEKLVEVQRELKKLQEERAQISDVIARNSNLDQEAIDNLLKAEKQRSELNETQRAELDLQERIQQKEAEIKAEQEAQQRIIDIRKRFLEIVAGDEEETAIQNAKRKRELLQITNEEIYSDEEAFNKRLEELGFEKLSDEEKLELLKLANQEKSFVIEQRKLRTQQVNLLAVKEEFINLAEKAFADSVDRQKEKTQELIDKVFEAQRAISSINGAAATGFAQGSTFNFNQNNNISSNVDLQAVTDQLLQKVSQ